MHVVGPIRIVTACVPRVQIDRAQIDQPQERGQIVDDRELDDIAGSMRDGADLDPIRPMLGRSFHEEELAIDAVRVSLHHHRPLLKVRQQRS